MLPGMPSDAEYRKPFHHKVITRTKSYRVITSKSYLLGFQPFWYHFLRFYKVTQFYELKILPSRQSLLDISHKKETEVENMNF